MIVYTDMSEFSALETGFIISGVVMGKRHIVVAVCPPDLGMGEGDVFLLGQW